MSATPRFDHEKLDVYKASIEFVGWTAILVEGTLAKYRLSAVKHLDRASTSVPLNIAEGNGKRSLPDRCRYFEISRGSALESAACLDVLVARKALQAHEIDQGKALLVRIVAMLSRMTMKTLGCSEHEHEHEHEMARSASVKSRAGTAD